MLDLGNTITTRLHLFESAKYGGRHFITNDGRLLKKAPEIWALLQIKVLKPSEFLASYTAHTETRGANR